MPLLAMVHGPIDGFCTEKQLGAAFKWWSLALPAFPSWVERMLKAGANEILMPTLQSADIWKESGRYEDYGREMLRIKDRNERDLLYGPTNEELVTEIFRTHIKSYKEH